MDWLFLIALALHVVPAVFWAGTTFGLARTGGAGAEALFRPQMGAAVLAIVMGVALWALRHWGEPGPMEWTLAFGAACALAAAIVQYAWRGQPARAQKLAAPLLGLALVAMVWARHIG
ncbi:MAG TPA: hypothetical protein VG841_05475 [Caulobacterales bacterium]|nr:hypothetical protein [Caulobacterales bacterium]